MSRNNEPSETSPLLGNGTKPPRPIDASAGIVPDNPAVTGEAQPTEDGGTVERQMSREERARQFEGDPDLKKKIKWMFPALALGVCPQSA
jgi:hypothetical protein